jgi:hypothetical protein
MPDPRLHTVLHTLRPTRVAIQTALLRICTLHNLQGGFTSLNLSLLIKAEWSTPLLDKLFWILAFFQGVDDLVMEIVFTDA